MSSFNSNIETGIRAGVVAVQPVVDKSGSALAQGLSNAAKTIFSAMPTKEDKVKAASEAALSGYQSELVKYADAVDQGRLKPAQARTKSRALYQQFISNNPSLAKSAAERHSKILSTAGLGKVIGEKDSVKEAEKDLLAEAAKEGFVFSTQTDVQQQAGLMAYRKYQRALQDMKDEAQSVSLRSSKVGLTSAEIKLRQAQDKEKATRLLDNVADGVRSKIDASLLDIRERLKTKNLTQDQAIQELTAQENFWNSEIANNARAAGSENLKVIMDPIGKMFDLARDEVSGKISKENAENRISYYKAGIQAGLLEDPKLRKLYGAGLLFPNAQFNNYADKFMQATDAIKNNSFNIDTTPYNLFDEDKVGAGGQKAVTNILKENINNTGKVDAGDKPAHKEQLDNNIINILRGVDVYEKVINKPEQLNNVIEFMASPEFSKWVGTGAMDQKVANNAMEVIKNSYMKDAKSVIEKMWLEPNYSASTMTAVQDQIKAGTSVQSMVEVSYDAGGIKFTAKTDDPMHASIASSYNKSIGPVINKLVRASSHLEGHTNYQQVFEANYGKLFDLNKDEGNTDKTIDNFSGGSGKDEVKGNQGGDEIISRNKPILDMIGGTEGTDRGDGYNETLAYGAYTGGDVNLTSMTLGEVKNLQKDMLNHPDNNWNSSAVGRYQIVGKTLRALMKKMDLDDDVVFDEVLQDKMAIELLKMRGLDKYLKGEISKGKLIDNISKEWASLPNTKGIGSYGGQRTGIKLSKMEEIIDSIS